MHNILKDVLGGRERPICHESMHNMKVSRCNCENEIFSRESFLSWAVFNTILASPEVPSTVSLTSCSAQGRELMKFGMRRGRFLREAKGLNSGCAGSCSSSVKLIKMGSPKESMRDLSSDWTTESCWRLFKVVFATKLPSGVVVAVAETILGALCCVDSRCSCNSSSLVRVRSSSSCKSKIFGRSVVYSGLFCLKACCSKVFHQRLNLTQFAFDCYAHLLRCCGFCYKIIRDKIF